MSDPRTNDDDFKGDAARLLVFLRGLKPSRDPTDARRDDAGALAVLRRALVDSEEHRRRIYELLGHYHGIPYPETSSVIHRAETVRTVAGLFAMPHLRDEKGRSFGKACLHLVRSDEKDTMHKAPGPNKPNAPGPVAHDNVGR